MDAQCWLESSDPLHIIMNFPSPDSPNTAIIQWGYHLELTIGGVGWGRAAVYPSLPLGNPGFATKPKPQA